VWSFENITQNLTPSKTRVPILFMLEPAEQAETKRAKCARILGELSELGLTLARDLHARALAAETVADAQSELTQTPLIPAKAGTQAFFVTGDRAAKAVRSRAQKHKTPGSPLSRG
jgi:hypothetical protein